MNAPGAEEVKSSSSRTRPLRLTTVPRAVFAGAVLAAVPASGARASEGLNLVPDLWMLGFMMVGFLLMIIPANALIFKPLFRVLDERRERIEGARRRAEGLQREAEELLRQFETAVAEVRHEAERERRAQLSAARADHAAELLEARGRAERELTHARDELAGALAEARDGLRASAEDLAETAAARILGRSLS